MMTNSEPLDLWTAKGRAIVFALASMSIVCLLLDFYRPGLMRPFTFCVLFPALAILLAMALFDYRRGNRRLWQAVAIGSLAGLGAAVAYDLFRLPFVCASQWGIDWLVPHLNLFKVFPRFGAMILGEPLEQSSYSLSAQVIGWAYHFSNGLTFGIMYLALIGDGRRRHWAWAVALALVLEAGMLLSPYPAVFQISLSMVFIAATLAAHLIFGVALGLMVRGMAFRSILGSDRRLNLA